MTDRLITPSQLALFSRSPVIGAWWEELHAQKLFQGERPAVTSLDELLFASGLQHEQVLLDRLEAEGRSIARLPGRQLQEDYDATQAAMHSGVDFIHQASLVNAEMRGSADLLERIERPSRLGSWSYIPIELPHPSPVSARVRPRGWFAWGWSWLLSIRRALRTEMPAAAAAASWLLPPRRFAMNRLRW